MFQSGSTLADGASLSTEVCIVGSGPAGLTVAAELIGAGIPVILVESGGREIDPAVQELSRMTFSDIPLINLPANRRRQVGGNANLWEVKMIDLVMGVRYVPLDEIDFQPLSRGAYNGWPLSRDELQPHYEAAQTIAQAGPFDYGPEAWSQGTSGPWPLDADLVESKVFQFAPRAAVHRHLVDRVVASKHVTIVHDATAVELLSPDAAGAIAGVRCRTLGGTTFTVEARRFVLATSGFGNPHLLLASRSSRPAGLANEHDLVGRYLQDHPLIDGGSLELSNPAAWDRSTFYDMRLQDGHSVMGYLALSPRVIESQGLGGMGALLFPRPNARRTATMEALMELSDAVTGRQLGLRHLRLAPRLAVGAEHPLMALYRKVRYGQSIYHSFERGGWSLMPGLPGKFARFQIFNQVEQTPEPGNRVTLNRQLDAVGMPTLNVHWSWSDTDAKRAANGRRIIAEELARAGIGRVTLPDDNDLPGVGPAAGTGHYMGTTRMHPDPRHGVVDADCRVHSVPNLYVAGSSVFPNSGYANPTLTIIALAHRLGRHLAR